MSEMQQQLVVLPNSQAPLVVNLLHRLVGHFPCGYLTLRVNACDYRIEGQQSGPNAIIELHDAGAVLKRFSKDGDIGLYEAYFDGHWDSPDLSNLLYWGAQNFDYLVDLLRVNRLLDFFNRIRHMWRRNSKRGSRRNIMAHYDLGNDFYRLWLDSGMTYSSALFESANETLEIAQDRKYARLFDQLDAKPGDHILEIGCGWGGFAEYAAKRGVRVTGLTLSAAQLRWGIERMANLGLSDLVDLRMQDYRDITGQFDHIVSIEMFEAVGKKYWPVFFEIVQQRLKPGGKAALQVITIAEKNFEHYCKNPDFIQLYIFPGGMLPSPTSFTEHADNAGLQTLKADQFGQDYANTLARWLQRFDQVSHEVEALDYDKRFMRMWRFYLAYCEAGFRSNRIDLYQYVLRKN